MKSSSYHRALFIFRRDVRLEDNTGLIAALKKSDSVIPCFIFDPQQVTKRNRFRSLNAVQFMIESLLDLKEQLTQRRGKLFVFYGSPDAVVKKLLHHYDIDLVCMNRDYTPYSALRDQRIARVCAVRKVVCEFYDDVLVHAPGVVTKKDKKPYTIFTPFFKRALRIKVATTQSLPSGKFFTNRTYAVAESYL